MKAKTFGLNALKVLLIPVGVYMFFFLASGGKFGGVETVVSILKQSLYPTLISYALCANMLANRMDVSIGSVVVVSAMLGARLSITMGVGLAVFSLAILGTAILLSLLVGLLYVKMRVPTIVSALGICMVYEALSNQVSISWVTAVKGDVCLFGTTPYCFILFGLMFALYYILFNHTKFGYQTRAIAGDQQIAANNGINVRRHAFLCYVVSGVFLGVGALLKISTQGSIDTLMYMSSTNLVFASMLGIFVAMALRSYCNIVVGIWIGNIIMFIMNNGLLSLGLSSSWQDVLNGAMLLMIMTITYNNENFAKWIGMRRFTRKVRNA